MKWKLITSALLITAGLNAQNSGTVDSTTFDFWVGDWNLTWTTPDGKTEKGSNHIVKILDGKVIQENFVDVKNSFKGTSISVFDARQKTWHQAWADNQGGYFDFEGSVSGDRKMFSTQQKMINGRVVVQRMAFYDIKTNSFTWDWEISKDEGKTWELQWRINYQRKGKT